MESNKKRKLRKKEYSEGRQKYYKNLRKEQKKKRKDRKRLQQGSEQNEYIVSRRVTIDLSRAGTEGTKKKESWRIRRKICYGEKGHDGLGIAEDRKGLTE